MGFTPQSRSIRPRALPLPRTFRPGRRGESARVGRMVVRAAAAAGVDRVPARPWEGEAAFGGDDETIWSKERLRGEVRGPARTFVFACDESEECVRGAQMLFDTLVKEGDTVHFVHVLCNDRDYSTSIDRLYSEEWSSEPPFTSSKMEHRSHLEAAGAKMMEEKYGRYGERSIRTQFHLPIVNGPPSSAEVGSVICHLAEDLNADLIVLVTPHRGTLHQFGSVGHHCYHHAQIPILAIPERALAARGMMHDTVLVVSRDEAELRSIRDWMKSWKHIFKGAPVEELNLAEAYLSQNCLEAICTKMKMTFPKVIILMSQADNTLNEELANPSFAPYFCSRSICPVLILHRAARSAQKAASTALAQRLVQGTAHAPSTWVST